MHEEHGFEQLVPRTLERPFARKDRLDHPLYVVTTVYNAQRYRSRWRLFADFRKMVAEAGAILYTVEIALGDRAFVVTTPDNPRDIQLRTWHELWYKEAGIRLGVQRLPPGWQKVAWIDADTHFARYDWADETLQKLEHYPIVQLFSQMQDLNPDHQPVGAMRSFIATWADGKEEPPQTIFKGEPYPYPYVGQRKGFPGMPGLAWAMRREAWEQLGGLVDHRILGGADWYMAHALTGQLEKLQATELFGRSWEMLLEWQCRAERSLWQERPILGNVGMVPGLLLHYWHGPKVRRRYHTRGEILREHSYDPDLDLKLDWQGLPQLTARAPQMRRDIQRYFSERSEDSIDVRET
jgi:hypothetical protein